METRSVPTALEPEATEPSKRNPSNSVLAAKTAKLVTSYTSLSVPPTVWLALMKAETPAGVVMATPVLSTPCKATGFVGAMYKAYV